MNNLLPSEVGVFVLFCSESFLINSFKFECHSRFNVRMSLELPTIQ